MSSASEFIFSPTRKVSIRILVRIHQPLYIHPQELNTEKDQVFAAQSGGSAALWDITHSEQSFTSVYRALAANRLESIWQYLLNFHQLTGRTEARGVETLLQCRQKPCFDISTISTCKKATLLRGAPSCHSPPHQWSAPSAPDHHWKGMGPWIACSRVIGFS